LGHSSFCIEQIGRKTAILSFKDTDNGFRPLPNVPMDKDLTRNEEKEKKEKGGRKVNNEE